MIHYNPYPRNQKRKEGKFPIKEEAKRKERKFPIKEWEKAKRKERKFPTKEWEKVKKGRCGCSVQVCEKGFIGRREFFKGQET